MTKNNLKRIASCLLAIATPCFLFGAEADAAVAAAPAKSSLDINVLLTVVTLVLLLPLYISSKTFVLVAKDFAIKKKNNLVANKAIVLVAFFMFVQTTFAQATDAPVGPRSGDLFSSATTTWILIAVIALFAMLIVYFSFLTNSLIKQKSVEVVRQTVDGSNQLAKQESSWIKTVWDKMNNFKPLTEEGTIDTGHSYDGIRELDNITPPWFIAGFVGSIIFAAIYLFTYHISKTSPLQIEEYNIEMAQAEKEKAAMLLVQGNNVDENTVAMLGLPDIETGKKIFAEKCIACHAATGGSMPGGVGPNLTDEYWIHGGSLKDIFKTIKYGWVEKGMIAWKDQLSAKQIAQIASFIKSIKGSHPANAKEPQGEIYTEETGTKTTADSTATDSITVKK